MFVERFREFRVGTLGHLPNKSGKSKRGLSKRGLGPKGANQDKKGPFGQFPRFLVAVMCGGIGLNRPREGPDWP